MNGPEHYREAERLLTEFVHLCAKQRSGGDSLAVHDAIAMIQLAQVHATLAHAAAAAWPVVDRYKGDGPLTNEWSDAIGWIIDDGGAS